MNKKFLWLYLALMFGFCLNPLWGEEDNPWDNVTDYKGHFSNSNDEQQLTAKSKDLTPVNSPLLSSIGSVQPAGPQDFCSNTNICLNLAALEPCSQPNPLAAGRRYFSFQDPKKTCPPPDTCPTYPFEVEDLHVRLASCGPETCFVLLLPSICSAIYPTDPNCPVPGNLLCQGDTVLVKVPGGSVCKSFVFPLPETCCVKEPYFACIEVITVSCVNLKICLDDTCNQYCNYVQFPAQPPIDPCPLGLPGDFAIWTSGFASCQNNCPHDNRGIDTLYFTPGIYSGDIDVNLILSIEVDDPLVNKNFSCNLELYIDGQLAQTVPETVFYKPTTGAVASIVRCLGFAPCSGAECGIALGEPLYCKPIERFGRPCDCRADIVIEFPFTGVSVPGAPPGSLRLVPIEIPCPPIICDPPPFFMEETYTVDDVYSTIFNLPGCTARPGDLNGDNKFGLPDIIGLVNVVFKGANQPNPPCRANANGDSMTNLTDIIYLVNHVFKSGPKPRTVPVCCL